MSYISLTGLTVAIGELLAMGEEAIENHAKSLATLLIDGLDGSGWSPYGTRERALAAPHIITLKSDGGEAEAAVSALRNNNIVCGSRNGRVRVSIAHFCNESDIRSLVAVLRRASDSAGGPRR